MKIDHPALCESYPASDLIGSPNILNVRHFLLHGNGSTDEPIEISAENSLPYKNLIVKLTSDNYVLSFDLSSIKVLDNQVVIKMIFFSKKDGQRLTLTTVLVESRIDESPYIFKKAAKMYLQDRERNLINTIISDFPTGDIERYTKTILSKKKIGGFTTFDFLLAKVGETLENSHGLHLPSFYLSPFDCSVVKINPLTQVEHLSSLTNVLTYKDGLCLENHKRTHLCNVDILFEDGSEEEGGTTYHYYTPQEDEASTPLLTIYSKKFDLVKVPRFDDIKVEGCDFYFKDLSYRADIDRKSTKESSGLVFVRRENLKNFLNYLHTSVYVHLLTKRAYRQDIGNVRLALRTGRAIVSMDFPTIDDITQSGVGEICGYVPVYLSGETTKLMFAYTNVFPDEEHLTRDQGEIFPETIMNIINSDISNIAELISYLYNDYVRREEEINNYLNEQFKKGKSNEN